MGGIVLGYGVVFAYWRPGKEFREFRSPFLSESMPYVFACEACSDKWNFN
jgi:hypothetical protein